MSIVERLEDAEVMLAQGRHEGALLAVLTAISGASRYRYRRGIAMSRRNPGQTMGDGEAFETFLEEQIALTKSPRMIVKRPDGTEMTLSRVVYQLFRCTMAHEGGLASGWGTLVADDVPGQPRFKYTSVEPLGFEISHSALIFLADLVSRAPEFATQAAAVRMKLMARVTRSRS